MPDAPSQDGNIELNSPKVDATGKPTQRAVSTAKQAHSICKALYDNAKTTRIPTATIIAGKYGGEPPWSEKELEQKGLNWQCNFNTNWLPSIIDRTRPQFQNPINSADTLTRSSLPQQYPDGSRKSDTFQKSITKCIRAWSGFKDFVSILTQELVLFGGTLVSRVDPDDWRSQTWRINEFFLPDGTGQHSTKVQCCAFKKRIPLHEYLKLIEDEKAAEAAGYNIQNMRTAANKSTGANRGTDPNLLEFEDSIREQGALGYTYEKGVKTVDVYFLMVQDYSGEVDFWMVSEADGLELRNVQAIHSCIGDALTLFTMQSANSKFYGSKGLGRMLTNIHIAIDRSRNHEIDMLYLAGQPIIRCDKKVMESLQFAVRTPFILIDKDAEVTNEVIEYNAEAYRIAVSDLNAIGETIAGAFVPTNLESGGGSNTKIEAAQDAERDIAIKEGILGRFFDQFSEWVSMTQRAICSKKNMREAYAAFQKIQKIKAEGKELIPADAYRLLEDAFGAESEVLSMYASEPTTEIADKEVVSCIIEMLREGLSLHEIAILALTPSATNSANEGEARDRKTVEFINRNRGNPFMDQKEATKMEGEIEIGDDRTRRLIGEKEDPNVEAYAIRDQVMEFGMMMSGEPMPVADTDNHRLHLKVLGEKQAMLAKALGGPAATPELVNAMELTVSHGIEHLERAKDIPDDQKDQMQKALKELWDGCQEVKKSMEQKAQAQAEQQQGTPMLQAAQQGQTGANPQIQVLQQDPDRALKVGQMGLEMKKAEQRDRELDMQERQMADEAENKAIEMQQNNIETLRQIAESEKNEGIEAGKREMQGAKKES